MANTHVKLLIVDDYDGLLTSLSEIFIGIGHTVRSASDGFSALAAMRQDVPDVLLSDLNMPGMSGFELLSVVRRRFPAVHVIAMSGAFPGEDIPEGIAADAFYEKGTGAGRLVKLMEDATRSEHLSLLQHPAREAPVWVKSNGHDPSGVPFITITCPECLRAFPQILENEDRLIHQANCIFCHTSVSYAVVKPIEEAAHLQPAFRKPATGVSTQLRLPGLQGPPGATDHR